MMDHKTWLWKKKSTEKTLVAADKANLSHGVNEEEIHKLLTDKAELGRDLKVLNEKLSSTLSVCNAKDDLVDKHAKMAQEALAGWEKAEAEAMSLKQELDEVLRQSVAGEERVTQLDMALKECMQQLCFVRDEQEQRIHDAVMKTSREFEKAKIVLEEKLADTNKRLSKLGMENTQLSKALLAKEKLIVDMNEQRSRAEADFKALMTRLESTEKENASLKYEVRVLEKELEIRNEEREFNRRTADVAHKQHLESVKKIAKLESECQRLRLLVRKRLPGPAALAKMKNEVEVLSRDQAETRRRKSNASPTGSMDFAVDNVPDTPSKRINYLAERLCAMEEENRSLKEILEKKTNELKDCKIMYARNASKLSQVEPEDSSVHQIAMESARNMPLPHETSVASMSDMGSDDKTSCAESWASALVSELEHIRNGKQMGTSLRKTVGASDIDLMDDFVEMEKFAIVSVDKRFGSPRRASVEASEIIAPLDIQSSGDSWLQHILKLVIEQNRVTQRKPDEILEDIRVALQHINYTNYSEFGDVRKSSNQFHASNHSVGGYPSWKLQDKSPLMDSDNRISGEEISLGKKSNHQVQSNLSKSIRKTIELIEGINLPSLDYGASEILPAKNGSYFPYKISEVSSGYMVRVFQWKTSELGAVLQKFIRTCNDLLSGSTDFEKFAEELTSSLDWVMNHCFSLQDVSSMRDAIKKQFDWDETRSENEVEQLSHLPIVSDWNNHKIEEAQPNVREESKKLKDELANVESAKKDLEGRLQSEIDKSESLMIRLQESDKTIKSLKRELETVKEWKGMIENEIQNNKMVNEDLDTQLKVARVELNEVRQRFSSLETELENKIYCCEKLEATCLDLQLQLESVSKKEIPKYDVDQEEETQLRSDWEITAASEKLAECQETILNLGKQLKALASPRDMALFDKLVSDPSDNITTSTTPKKNFTQRSSLLDKMLAEDNAGDLKFLKAKEVVCTSNAHKPPALTGFHSNVPMDSPGSFLHFNGIKHNDDEGGSLAIVPAKKKGGGGLLKKLLWRRTRGKSKKPTLPHAA
ncbi:filament-like plant protein 7 [Actinidia eriantha]|uniref:filament-like plant protein 7 n=1 Tax=Actinidia eriantha TaxID=165200 RepID=UPI00258F34BE|nr:filament-like plant protein 7 [Actinidia eriantha]